MTVDEVEFVVDDEACPLCGGTTVTEDGWRECTTPGTCCFAEEIE